MTSLLDLKRGDKVLEIGTGSGLSRGGAVAHRAQVYSVEIVEPIASQASKRLSVLGYHNVEVRYGDGYQGWPDKAPFDAILLSAAPPSIPKPLLQQLRVGGKMVVPLGGGFFQDLLVITKAAEGDRAADGDPGPPLADEGEGAGWPLTAAGSSRLLGAACGR